ncbi:MAG: RluA family pseudouridine synthase [Candidatus Kerfeldbacteria bacterium]|nr:RluA family pseudouridine synthase [Candidatus Kerfeldbacteria bacterium]
MAIELTVEIDAAKERLDKFLVRHLVGTSRSKVQKLIEAGAVRVNGEVVSAHRGLKPDDVVTVSDDVEENPMPPRAHVPAPDIIFEDDDILVINKPSGLTVHPGAGTPGPTLIDWLIVHVPSITNVGDDPAVRPGIVHRLDRDVSGVMVIAKTQPAFDQLKQQFKDRTATKEYLALVHGLPQKTEGTIRFKIDRSERMHGRMAARPEDGEGREAITHYFLERPVKNNALLRLRIETGRTHQIRVHLKAIGHPIVGDSIYTTKSFRHKAEPIDRPFLHAARLVIHDLAGAEREFTAPLPSELRRLI